MATLGDSNTVYTSVKDYYGKVLESSKDLKTSACTAGAAPHPLVRKIISTIPDAVNDKFYGCGNPLPLGIEGMDVLDLGSGSGRDCYVAAALVGAQGSVTGVDMTDEQLSTARENIAAFGETLGYTPNLKFLTGYIEELQAAGVPDSSADICISNCVINLSPDKPRVFAGVYQALRSGGELHFSDVYADRQLPAAVRSHDVLLGECIGGALFAEEFEQMAVDIGFARPRVLSVGHIAINDPELLALVGDARFFSITYRLFKVQDRVEIDEGGFVAEYLGTIEGHEDKYKLDVDHVFTKGVSVCVDAATAAVLSSTWLARFFVVSKVQSADGFEPAVSTTSTESLMDQAYKASSSSSGCCAPKSKETSGCCAPKSKETSGCCAPKSKETSGCCAPKKSTADCCSKSDDADKKVNSKLEMLSCSGNSCC